MGRWQIDACHSPSPLDRRTRCQSFQAIAVKRTTPAKWITLPIVRHSNVSHLRVNQPMQHAATYDGAAANSGTNSLIYKIRKPLCRSPSCFAQSSHIHVRIKPYGQAEGPAHGADKIKIPPTCLWGGSYESEARGTCAQIHRAE